VVKKEGSVVRIEGGVVKKCKTVVKTLKTVVKFFCIMTLTGLRPNPHVTIRRRKARQYWCAAAGWTALGADRALMQGTRPSPPRHRLAHPAAEPPLPIRSTPHRPSRPGLTCPPANQEAPPLSRGRSATGTPSHGNAARPETRITLGHAREVQDDTEGRKQATRASTGCYDTPRDDTPQ
jgi:hypothetical protein